MDQELTLRIILEDPPPGVDFGLQQGSGNDYQTVQTQRSKSGDLRFEFNVRVQEGKEGQPNFLGPYAQGPAKDRFVYLDVGTLAGQKDSEWTRRIKIPIYAIQWPVIKKALGSRRPLEARIHGQGRDGTPSCGSVKNFGGWSLAQD